MPQPLVVLDAMPSAADFYALYWNRRPFVVRGAILPADMDGLIAADELAGLSLEEAPRSRMVMSAGDQHNWSCRLGPFDEQDFATAGERDWSLLVQNVEQFHPATAALLRHFNFAPRWLMDDIMVSFSAPGGSVGAHIDSYHVFLVQGQGRRRWTVGREVIRDEVYVEGIDFKILKNDFDGDAVEVSCGDVLYLPPRFGHEGTTLESALTFSIGFLGPKMSELLSGYGQYLSECEDLDQRYVGDGLDGGSAGFVLSPDAVGSVRERLRGLLDDKAFSRWLVEFFTESSHEDFATYTVRADELTRAAFAARVAQGGELLKPYYVKFAITTDPSGGFRLGFDRHSFVLDKSLLPVIQTLMKEEAVSAVSVPGLFDLPGGLALLRELYNHEALAFM